MGISFRTAAIASALLLAFLTIFAAITGPASPATATTTLPGVSVFADGADGSGNGSAQGDGNTWG